MSVDVGCFVAELFALNRTRIREKVQDSDSRFTKGFVKIECDAGKALDSLPKQYKQAALLLVGHYYNMREAEAVGGITMELKEGVQRLMASARLY